MRTCSWRPCTGEAHANPHIDHCGSCAPRWGAVATCPDCGAALRWSGSRKTATCPNGHGRFVPGPTPTSGGAWVHVGSIPEATPPTVATELEITTYVPGRRAELTMELGEGDDLVGAIGDAVRAIDLGPRPGRWRVTLVKES